MTPEYLRGKSTWQARHDARDTIIRAADALDGQSTLKPVKVVDTAGPQGLVENSSGVNESSDRPTNLPVNTRAKTGRILVLEVVEPILSRVLDLAHPIATLQAVTLLRRGFSDLSDRDPETAYDIIMDLVEAVKT
jgi:serine/threonine-protein kinase 24/25/MST4